MAVVTRPSWLVRHWHQIVWLVGGILIGGTAGWLAGSYTTCARSQAGCEVRWESIEAAGTWVGGLGTIAAVLAAVVAFRSEEQARRDQMDQEISESRERLRIARREAGKVQVDAIVGGTAGHEITEIRVHVTNGTNTTPAFKLTGSADGLGPLRELHRLDPGEGATTSFRFGHNSGNQRIDVPMDEHQQYVADLAARVEIEFEMNGHRWKRVGSGPVELV